VIAGLFRSQFANWREDTEGIASQHDNIRRLTINHARDERIGNELDWVGTAGVFRNADIIVVGHPREGVVDDVL